MTTLVLLLAASLPGCGVDSDDAAEDFDTVVTARVPEFAFEQVTTYVLADKVAVIQDPENPDANATIDTSREALILQTTAQQMDARGYQRLTDPGAGADPDVFLQVSAMATTNTTVYYSYWYPYWGTYYAPWYGSTYSAGYAPYASPVVTSVNIGTVVIDMTNPNQPDTANQKIPSIWVGVLSGILDGDVPNLNQRITDGIQQAFNQSPYLRKAAP